MHVGLGDANQTSQPALGQFTIPDPPPEGVEQAFVQGYEVHAI
jgi:hypothetical protein